MQYEAITHKIIGCAMKVHNVLGSGFRESIYQKALSIEMTKQELVFGMEIEMKIFYEEIEIGKRRVDFFVADKIMLELKAVSAIDDQHLAQAINYLEAYKLPIGLLINFGAKSLEYKRVYNTKHPDNAGYRKP
jgi:GxxExxY protein